jgi:hypothetical protein
MSSEYECKVERASIVLVNEESNRLSLRRSAWYEYGGWSTLE